MASTNILEEYFEIKDINPDGKYFEKGSCSFDVHNSSFSSHSVAVSRLLCHGENYEMEMLVDINTDIYPVSVGEKFTVVLTESLDPQVSYRCGCRVNSLEGTR